MSAMIASTTESCKISRDHLTNAEVAKLIEVVKKKGGCYAYRNATLILILYRHGLRRTEVAHLRWSDLDLAGGTIYIRRVKGSRSGRHPLQGDEMRALKKLKRDYPLSPFVFTGNRHTPFNSSLPSHV